MSFFRRVCTACFRVSATLYDRGNGWQFRQAYDYWAWGGEEEGGGEGTCSFIREQLTGLRVANLHSPLSLPLPSLDRYGISWPTEKFQPSVRVSFSCHDELPLVNAIFLAGDARLANGYVCRVRTFKMRARSVTKLGLVDVQECFRLLPKEGMGSELRSSKCNRSFSDDFQSRLLFKPRIVYASLNRYVSNREIIIKYMRKNENIKIRNDQLG